VTAARTVVRVDFRREQRERATTAPEPRLPRVVGLLALAHEIERQIRAGTIRDHADAARRLGWTRARVAQVARLTLLAPSIQVAVLALPPGTGRDPITERQLRPIAAEPSWEKQIERWRRLS